MGYKSILGILAVLLTFVGFFPYFRSIVRGNAKPHIFSWIIWGITTLIVFLVQVKEEGGAGSWAIGVSAVTTFIVAILAYFKKSDSTIAPIDWIFFVLALASLPFWFLTSDPFWAVVILTIVDVCGFGPTLRKAYEAPFEENLVFYGLFTFRSGISIAALESYSVTTVLFPAVIGVACLLLVIVVAYRRKVVAQVNQLDLVPIISEYVSIMQYEPLENELVKLVLLQSEDFERLYQVASDPLIWVQHPVKDRHQREVFSLFFEEAIASKSSFLIIDNLTKAVIGNTRFYDYRPEEPSIAIGYTFLSRAYWGGRYNTAVKSLMLDYIFKKVDKVFFHVGALNLRSQKAVLKLGAAKVAEIEREFSGRVTLYHEYALSKAKWQSRL